MAAALESLVEFYDTVQIFVTKHGGSDEMTIGTTIGRGNIFARVEQVRLWSEAQEGHLLNSMAGPESPDEEEGDEDK